MGKVNSGWVRRQAAVLLSATLAFSPVLAVPAMAAESGDDAPAVEMTAEKDVEQAEESSTEGTAELAEDTASKSDMPVDATGNDVTPQVEGVAEPRSAVVATVRFLDGSTKEYDTLSGALSAATREAR